MPKYKLEIDLSQSTLQSLYTAGQNVVIAKPSQSESPPNVAWQVFRPMEANAVEWEENYGIYASTVAISNGAKLTKMSATPFPAAEGSLYPLGSNGYFEAPTPGKEKGSYFASNAYENNLTFGLFQDATVNGKQVMGNAISAAPVPINNVAEMTPYTTVYVWAQSLIVSNTVVTTVTSPKTKVTFGGKITDIVLGYADGAFIVEKETALPAGASVETIMPALADPVSS
jgi:hypothetical protein